MQRTGFDEDNWSSYTSDFSDWTEDSYESGSKEEEEEQGMSSYQRASQGTPHWPLRPPRQTSTAVSATYVPAKPPPAEPAAKLNGVKDPATKVTSTDPLAKTPDAAALPSQVPH